MPLYDIDISSPSADFMECWKAAGDHLNRQLEPYLKMNTDDVKHCVHLRAHPFPPYMEHLSFRIGNQNFYIRIEDADQQCEFPGHRNGLTAVAEGNGGWPCILPMVRRGPHGQWKAQLPGWGLMQSKNRESIDPPSVVTDELIQMTDWEIYNLGIETVSGYLHDNNYEIMGCNDNPLVNPSIWFIGKSETLEWVVVSTAKFPEIRASQPKNVKEMVRNLYTMSKIGYFASVGVANASQGDNPNDDIVPLWRGQQMKFRYDGLEPLMFPEFFNDRMQ